MTSKTVTVQGPGFPVVGILGLIFVLCKVFAFGPIATWSWLWVLAPFWIGAALVLSIFVIFALLAAIFAAFS